jgi:AcrR family transcriptional regulator
VTIRMVRTPPRRACSPSAGRTRWGLKDVAREAGVSHALVTHYVGTYAALVDEALASHVRRCRAAFFERFAQSGDDDVGAWLEHLYQGDERSAVRARRRVGIAVEPPGPRGLLPPAASRGYPRSSRRSCSG